MTIESGDFSRSYAGSGAVLDCPFPLKFWASSELRLVRLDAAGAEHALTLGTDFTISGGVTKLGRTTYPDGCTIRYPKDGSGIAVLPVGQSLFAYVEIDFTQTMDLVNSSYDRDLIEDGLDRLTKLCIQLRNKLDRAVKFPVSTATGSVPDATSYLAQVSAMVAAAASAMDGSETARAASEAAKALAQAAQAAAESARDQAQAITGFPGSYQTPTPVITGTSSGNEATTASGGISNFDASAIYTWIIPAAITTWSFNNSTGAWSFTFPTVSADTPYTLAVSATRAGELRSMAGTKTVTSLDVPIQDGPTMTFNDNATGFPDGDFS